MEILTYLRVLRRRWPLVVATVAVALGLAYASAPRTRVYRATSTIVVGPRQLSTDPNRSDFSGDLANGLTNLTATYAALLDSEVIATEAVRRTGVPRSPGGVVAATTATAVPATQVLRVSVVDPVPAVAQALATGMATAFVDRVTSFTPGTPPSVGSPPAVPVYLYQPAGLPFAPLPLGTRSRLATAGIFGLLAAVGAVLLLEHLDLSVRTVADAERRLRLPVLGAIPLVADRPGSGPGPAGRP
jgi:capsular polysaccharide biosynthesis protein